MKKVAKRAKNRPRKKRSTAQQSGGFSGGQINRQTGSWILSGLSADAEIRTHLPTLRYRCRDLERNSDYVRAFLEDTESNTLGSEGVLVQMKVKEEADRVVHDPSEKAFIQEFVARENARRKELRLKIVRRGLSEARAEEWRPDIALLHRNGNRAMKVLKGQPDVYANDQIEKAWKRFGLKDNFTVTRETTRHEAERMWLRSTARDGSCLVRKVKGFDNEFGFSLQFIDMDWLDINYNERRLENGNEVRMGKEYNKWRECVAYHIIVRQPGDWMWSTSYAGYSTGANGRHNRQRIDANEIVHGYIRERIDQSREIPWLVSAITRLAMLGKFEEAELVASLLAARKTGTWYSDINADPDSLGAFFDQAKDCKNKGDFEEATEPGQDTIAPPFWKYQVNDPTHPNTNVEQFRKVMLQGIAAALPGSSYHRISQDPSGLSFSNLRGIELQSRESWKMVQRFMEDNFHTSIFGPWLEAGLMSGAIPLPVSKFDKFNAPYWIFRRWKGIDPIKEAEGNKANLLLTNTTRTKIAAESGYDFEELIEQLVLEEDMLEVAGLEALMLPALAGAMVQSDGQSASDGSGEDEPPKPAKSTTIPITIAGVKKTTVKLEHGEQGKITVAESEEEILVVKPAKKTIKFQHDKTGKVVGAVSEEAA